MRVYLDGDEWRSVPAEVVRDLGLREGQQCDPAALSERIAAAEPAQAWERALHLLNFRDRGSMELRGRLLDDSYGEHVADAVVQRARDLGFIDDRRFAEGLALASQGKRHGRRRVASALTAKGVDEELAAEVLSECCDDDSEHERAVALARALTASRPLDPRRLASRLVSRGFDTGLAWRVASQVAGHADGTSDVD